MAYAPRTCCAPDAERHGARWTVHAGAKGHDPATSGCLSRPEYHRLDFWLGDWDVYAGGALDGKNHIVAILQGCAIEENWSDASGFEGKSWFYLDPHSRRFKQVWLTDHADQPGGTKEKSEVPSATAGIHFRGVLNANNGVRLFDRTTLTPLPNGRVHQLIEISRDGETWKVAYDAEYRRAR